MPNSVLNWLSSYELVFKRTSKFEFLRVFGSLCFPNKVNKIDKFSERDKNVFHMVKSY